MATRSRIRVSDEDFDLLGSDAVAESGDHPSHHPSLAAAGQVAAVPSGGETSIGIDPAGGRHGSPVYRRGHGFQSRFSINRQRGLYDDSKKPRRSFCRSWCEMWFLLARSKLTCVSLSVVLFGGGILLILLTAFGGLEKCPTLHGAVIFCQLLGALSLSLGFLCCCYHWVKDDEDLPFAIFCVAYCLLILFMSVTIAGTVVVFTRIHPLGPDQPPPGVPLPNKNLTVAVADPLAAKECGMVELPLGVLVICYVLSVAFCLMSYFACILALGVTSDIPPL